MTEIKTEAGSVERLRLEAARREAALQADRQRNERVEGQWNDERLARERDYAGVGNVRLGDLSALLSLQDELVAALEACAGYIASPLRMSSDCEERQRRDNIVDKARSLLTRIKSERDRA